MSHCITSRLRFCAGLRRLSLGACACAGFRRLCSRTTRAPAPRPTDVANQPKTRGASHLATHPGTGPERRPGRIVFPKTQIDARVAARESSRPSRTTRRPGKPPRDGPGRPGCLDAGADSLATIDDNLREAEFGLRREISTVLTVEQQARLYVFEAGFDRQARHIIDQIREDRDKPKRK